MQNTFPAAVSRNFNRLQEAAGHAAHNLSARAHDANVARQEMLRRIVQHCKEFQGVHLHRSLGQAGLSLALYGGIWRQSATGRSPCCSRRLLADC